MTTDKKPKQMTMAQLVEDAKKDPSKYVGKLVMGRDGAWYRVAEVTPRGFRAEPVFVCPCCQKKEN